MLNPAKFPERILYCPACKDDRIAVGVAPKCPNCNHDLVEILKIDGERITGAKKDEDKI